MGSILTKTFLWVFQFYVGFGLLFALAFVIWGIHRVDEDAQGTSWAFRLLMIPGSMAFWPFLLREWFFSDNLPKD